MEVVTIVIVVVFTAAMFIVFVFVEIIVAKPTV